VHFDNLIRKIISQHALHNFPIFSKYNPYTIFKEFISDHDVPIKTGVLCASQQKLCIL